MQAPRLDDRGFSVRTALTLLFLFAAGTLLGVCLRQPQLITLGWEALLDRTPRQQLPSGNPGDVDWRQPPFGDAQQWHRVVVGHAPPVRDEATGEQTQPRSARESSSSPAPETDTAPSPTSLDTANSVLVERGTTLWSIAEQRYGSANGDALLEALARYNRLEAPDRLEAGQRIWLPALDQLLDPE